MSEPAEIRPANGQPAIVTDVDIRERFDTLDDLFFMVDLEGRIFHVNQAVSRKLGYSESELLQMNVLQIHTEQDRTETASIFHAIIEGERSYCPLPLKRSDGSSMAVETHVWRGQWCGMDCVFAICKDLSMQQAALDLFARLFEANPALIAVSNIADGRILSVNDAFSSTTGYDREELLGRTCDDIGLFVSPDRHRAAINQLRQDGSIRNVELEIRSRQGSSIHCLFFGEVIRSNDDRSVLTVMIDITDRKVLEKTLQDKEKLLLAVSDATSRLLSQTDLYAAINDGFARIGEVIQVSRIYLWRNKTDPRTGEVLTDQIIEWVADGIEPQINNPQLQNVRTCEMDIFFERLERDQPFCTLVKELPHGVTRSALEMQSILSILVLPIRIDDELWGFVGYDDCSSERIWSEAEFSILRSFAVSIASAIARDKMESALEVAARTSRQSLEEKELLLKEIHHRVKNNLQIISSLLSLQTGQINDPTAIGLMRDSEARIRTMALIHELIYQTPKLSEIDFSIYVAQLARYLQATYVTDSARVTIRLDILGVHLSIDQSVSCGLLINELLSNALKHAFIGRKTGQIKLVMRMTEHGIVHLTVSDNGIGYTTEQGRPSKTLGMQLISSLVSQLKGNLRMDSSQGLTVSIQFPAA